MEKYNYIFNKYIGQSSYDEFQHLKYSEKLMEILQKTLTKNELIKIQEGIKIANQSFFEDHKPLAEILNSVLASIPQICNELSKTEATYELRGGSHTVPDEKKSLVSDIMSHIIKNSLDHGIEDSTNRAEKGKPAAGKILIDAKKSPTGLTIVVEDDGQGLNLIHLKAKGIEQKIISENASDEEVANLIFCSGLSTAEKVSEVSGRGVGMGAVKAFLEDNRGEISIVFTDESSINGYRKFQFVTNI